MTQERERFSKEKSREIWAAFLRIASKRRTADPTSDYLPFSTLEWAQEIGDPQFYQEPGIHSLHRRLSDWSQKGLVTRVARGVYVGCDTLIAFPPAGIPGAQDHWRIEKVKELLTKHGYLSVSEICRELGLGDALKVGNRVRRRKTVQRRGGGTGRYGNIPSVIKLQVSTTTTLNAMRTSRDYQSMTETLSAAVGAELIRPFTGRSAAYYGLPLSVAYHYPRPGWWIRAEARLASTAYRRGTLKVDDLERAVYAPERAVVGQALLRARDNADLTLDQVLADPLIRKPMIQALSADRPAARGLAGANARRPWRPWIEAIRAAPASTTERKELQTGAMVRALALAEEGDEVLYFFSSALWIALATKYAVAPGTLSRGLIRPPDASF